MATAEQLEAAILAILAESGGKLVPWAELRAQLPRAPFWRTSRALLALHESGKLCVFKVGGRNYVDPIVLHLHT